MKSLTLALSYFLIIFFTAGGQSALAQQPLNNTICKSQPVNDPRVKGRSSYVQFPDGRTITVVGHYHGDRQIYEMVDLMISGKLSTMSAAQFEAYMKKLLANNMAFNRGSLTNEGRRKISEDFRKQFGIDVSSIFDDGHGFDLQNVTVLAHAQQDFSYLMDLVKSRDGKLTDQNIQFVGYEGTEENWKNNFPNYLSGQRILLNEFSKRQKDVSFSDEQIRNIIMSSSNGSIYVYMQNPQLIRIVPMVGVESRESGQKYEDAESLQKMADAFAELGKVDDAHWDTRPEAELEAFKKVPKNLFLLAIIVHLYQEVESMNISTISVLENKLKLIDLTDLPWLYDSFQKLTATMKQRITLNANRDFNSARNLAGQHESGIHFVGLNHYRNTVRDLEQLCFSEMAGTIQTTPVSATH